MKKNIVRFLMSLLFVTAMDLQADGCCEEYICCDDQTGFYAEIFGGANFLQNTTINDNKTSYQTGYLVAGSLGYCWHYGLRLEAEYAYRRNAIKKIDFFTEGSSKHGHIQSSSYMANILWDVPLSSLGCSWGDLQPIIGAGIGYDFRQMHASNDRIVFNQKWNQFSWQLMAGLAYPIFCNTKITMEYKFHRAGCHFYNHSIGLGLDYKFGF